MLMSLHYVSFRNCSVLSWDVLSTYLFLRKVCFPWYFDRQNPIFRVAIFHMCQNMIYKVLVRNKMTTMICHLVQWVKLLILISVSLSNPIAFLPVCILFYYPSSRAIFNTNKTAQFDWFSDVRKKFVFHGIDRWVVIVTLFRLVR